MSKLIKVSVEIGYELHTITLKNDEWKKVKNGERFTKELESYYEGEALPIFLILTIKNLITQILLWL